MTHPFPYKRIVVIGTTSSGKSTLGKLLSEELKLDFIELDALHWEPNWKEAEDEVFRERVRLAIKSNTWVVAGNYRVVRGLIWTQAQIIIWLDYPLHILLWRLLWRTIQRNFSQELLWGTNRDKFWKHLKLWSDESLINWLFKTYWRRKREIPVFFTQPQYEHLKLLRFKHPRETQKWLKSMGYAYTPLTPAPP